MAQVIFQRGSEAIGVDVPATRQWALPANGAVGDARITLSRRSPALSARFISETGGSVVRILDQAGCGDWFGVVAPIEWGGASVTIVAYQLWKLLSYRTAGEPRTFRRLFTSQLAMHLLRGATSSLRALQIPGDRFPVEGVLTDRYSYTGQDVYSVLSDLMDAGNGELDIDPLSGDVRWSGSMAGVRLYPAQLVAGGNLRNVTVRDDPTVRLSEARAVAESLHDSYAAREARADGWPGQVTVNVTTTQVNDLYAAATAQLAAHNDAASLIEGDVPPALWGLRERDHVQVHLPSAGFGGRFGTYRVLSRTVGDSTPLMHVQLMRWRSARETLPGRGRRSSVQRREGHDLVRSIIDTRRWVRDLGAHHEGT